MVPLARAVGKCQKPRQGHYHQNYPRLIFVGTRTKNMVGPLMWKEATFSAGSAQPDADAPAT
jgi:hypothetical protein